MKQIVYADNAATTKLDSDAFEAMKPYMLEEYGNPSQPYAFSRLTKQAIKDAREKIAFCIGADPEEIVFTSGGTESDNWAIKCFCQPGKNVITSEFEHHAILHTCEYLEKKGFPVPKTMLTKSGESIFETEVEAGVNSTWQRCNFSYRCCTGSRAYTY